MNNPYKRMCLRGFCLFPGHQGVVQYKGFYFVQVYPNEHFSQKNATIELVDVRPLAVSQPIYNSFAARSDVRGVAQCKCSCEKCQKWPFKLSNCNLCCLCDASSACGSYDTVTMVPYVLQNWSYYCRMIFMMSESWHNYHTTRSIM